MHSPKSIRPTAGRVKEYIFSQVGEFAHGAKVLDLFAGSGALGIEALSRHAVEAVFVDKSYHSVISIKKNLQKIALDSKVVKTDVFRFLASYKAEPFNLVFIDPPYMDFEPETVLEAVEKSKIMQKGGHLVYEMSSTFTCPDTNKLLANSFRTFGDTSIGVWFLPEI